MVQITRENKRKVYAYLLEEGVIVVKRVNLINYRNSTQLLMKIPKSLTYMFGA